MSCTKSQEYLAEAGVDIAEHTDARKKPIDRDAALELLEEIDDVYVAKGKNVVRFDLKNDQPDKNQVIAAILGPTGNLRAPTLRIGRTLVVGFNEAMYEKVLN
jgi:arsenate reductase-like glutaredoxin family protein